LIEALYKLGKFIVEYEELDDIDVFQDTAKLTNRTKRVLLINLKNINGNFFYNGIVEEELSKSDTSKYLYKGGTPNGVDYTPASLITSKVELTFKNRVLKWFNTHKDPEFFDKIFEELNYDKDQIILDLDEKFKSIDKKYRVNVLLTISILQDGFKNNYLGDYAIFRKILKEESVKRYHNLKTIGESSGEGTCCSCDGQGEVYGFVPNAFGFSFSTADKKGNVPNFIQADQWKQVPICEKCAIFLEAGKKFIQEYLSFNLFTLKFFIIPNFLFKGDCEEFEEFYNRVVDLKGKKYEKGLIEEEDAEEDSLYSIVKDLDDMLEFKFLFYDLKGGGKFIDIINYVESVLPSWMKKIYNAQDVIKDDILFQEDNLKINFGKNVEGNFIKLRGAQSKGYINQYNWYAGFLREFFPPKHDKYFLDLIGFIVGGKPINKDFLISNFMDKIRKAHRTDPENEYSMKLLTIESMMLYMFFNELNLLKGVDKMKIGSHNEEDNEKEFFEVYGEFIDTPDKKAVFLMGLITKKLTAIQYNALKATPFMTKLWGLSLDQKKIHKLYPMLINKLREYKAAYPNLEELTSINLLKSNKNWKLSADETSFYFVLGFTLNGIFKSKKNEGVKNEQI
jgi:CRISPR-associated protein Csh1